MRAFISDRLPLLAIASTYAVLLTGTYAVLHALHGTINVSGHIVSF